MFDVQKLIRSHIQDMPAYEPVMPFEVLSRQLDRDVSEIIKLDANENPYGSLPEVRQALKDMAFSHIYPDPGSQDLRRALADHHKVPVENLLAGAGADELIDLILRLVIDPGDAILNCPPTFGMYSFDGDLNQARVIQARRRPDFSLDLAAIEAAVQQQQPKLIFLASPNNPDGSLTPRETIERLLKLPLLVVMDEAYIEFAPAGSSLLSEAAKRENLIVLRTFSKWAGLAGLRVGYAAFPSALMPHLWKIKQPYNVSVAAATAAIVSLQHADKLRAIGERIVSERERLYTRLRTVPYLKPYPSLSNFILCRVEGRDAAQLKQALSQSGILVRHYHSSGLADCIRISVGKPEHTDRLMTALQNLE